MNKKLALGLDLGGTHISCGLIASSGEIIAKSQTDINVKDSPEKIIQRKIIPLLKETILKANLNAKEIIGVGLGIPGNLDRKKGICIFSPNFLWRNVNLANPIKKALNFPLFMTNDVNAAALGEKYFGAGYGISDFICIAIGTGIGGGIVANNKLVYGYSNGAGEIGHVTVQPDGLKCKCGNYGCMEAYASGPNIAKRTKTALKGNTKSILLKMKKNINTITAKDLYYAALKKDKLALKIWKETGIYLGIGLSSSIAVLNPQRIIIGGKVSTAMIFFLPSIKKEINKRNRMIPEDSTEIFKAKLGTQAGMIGAAALVFEEKGILK